MNADMPPKMRRFMKRRPRHRIDPKRAYPRGWLPDCLKKQRGKCHYCHCRLRRGLNVESPGETPTIDHVVPLSAGGENKRKNVVVACVPCNRDKGSMSEREFRALLVRRKIDAIATETDRPRRRSTARCEA